jgi:hypothetical protein
MADKSDPGVPQFFELGALEREGAFWRFTLSNADCGLLLKYGSEENARRARMLIFEALRDVLQSSTEAVTPSPMRRLRRQMRVLRENVALWLRGKHR